MFGDKTYEAEGFDSTWRNEKESNSISVQTTEFSVKEQGTNTGRSVSAETQTETLKETDVAHKVDMNKLAEWLKAVCPNMIRELDDGSVCSAMASVQLDDTAASMLQEVQLPNDASHEKLFVSGMSWNATGNTVAVSSSFPHETWCYHEGEVHLFTFNRDNELPASPTKELVCASCVTAVSFHPTLPSVLCAGSISGELFLWNSQDDDKDGLIASISAHDERVTALSWITGMDPKQQCVVLASAGLDSYLNLWDVNIEDSAVELKQRYTVGKSGHHASKKCAKGIVQFDFSPHFAGVFVVGLEGGMLIKCTLLGAKQLPVGEADLVSVFDPCVSVFEKHEGEISTISFAPHRKDLFLTCATDNEIRIYNTEQVTPTQIIFVEITLHSVSWVPYVEKLLVGCGENGCIKLFSMLNGRQIPIAATDNLTPLTQMALNKKRIDMAVFGNTNGQLQLWSFPWTNIATQDSFHVYGK